MFLTSTQLCRLVAAGPPRRGVALGVLLTSLSACGARARGDDPPAPASAELRRSADGGLICLSVKDCDDGDEDLCEPIACEEGRCVVKPPVDCDDHDPCTADTCDSRTGECSNEPLTFDEDDDGYRAPLAGFAPGDPAACGDDCDDTSDRAHPGGAELCDGVDNDCNGVVDDGFSLEAITAAPVRISEPGVAASLGGLTYNDEFFAISYSSENDHQQFRIIGLSATGQTVLAPADVPLVNNDTNAGPIVWTGKVFGVAWEDRRDGDFEIYFNRLDTEGNKLGADLRVTDAPDFSLNPSMKYTGQEYLLFWQDRRLASYRFGVWAQRISRNGALIGDNIWVTPDLDEAEGPSTALGRRNIGLAFNSPFDGGRQVVFRTVEFDLSGWGPPVVVSDVGGAGASVRYNDGTYVVAWETYVNYPGESIWGAVLSEDGELVVPQTRLTGPAEFARSHSLVPMGDRLLLIWGEYSNGSYDLYRRWLTPDLQPLTDAVAITQSAGDVFGSGARLGADGELGVAFMDRSGGQPVLYFTTLLCSSAPLRQVR